MMLADLGIAVVDQQPDVPGMRWLVGEVEPDYNAMVREPFAGQVDAGPGPQHQSGVGVIVTQLQPLLAPAGSADRKAERSRLAEVS